MSKEPEEIIFFALNLVNGLSVWPCQVNLDKDVADISRANSSPSTPHCVSRAASAWRRNTLLEPYATKVPCYSLSYLWIKSLLPLHCTNNFFFVFLLKKYNFFILFLHTHSIPQLSFPAQRKWTKMRSESDHNFNSWHIFGQTVLPVPFSSTTTTTSQKQTFTRIQTLISKRNSSAVNTNFQIIISPVVAFFCLHLHSAVKSLKWILSNSLSPAV